MIIFFFTFKYAEKYKFEAQKLNVLQKVEYIKITFFEESYSKLISDCLFDFDY